MDHKREAVMETIWKPKIIGIYLIYGYYQKIFDLSQLPSKTKFGVKLPSPPLHVNLLPWPQQTIDH